MPIKFKPSMLQVDRVSGKRSYQHYYMKNTPMKELVEEMERAVPKRRQKIANELVRRENLAKSNCKK